LKSKIDDDSRAQFFKEHSYLVDRLQKVLILATGSIPSEVHHYTNGAAILQILKDGELWASNALFLNDAEEVEWGIGVYTGLISGARKAKEATHSKRILDLFDASALHAEMLRQSSVFVCCLSAAENQLSQWRAYCKSGMGYSLGFNTNGLQAMQFGDSPLSLRRVFYGPEEQVHVGLETIAGYAQYIDALPEESWERDKTRLNQLFIGWLHSLLIGMKSKAFSEEREWRLVYRDWDFGTPKYSFRTSHSGMIVPYCPLRAPNNRLPLTRIIVGPTNHSAIAIRSMEQLLRKFNYADVPVEFCDIPFREL